MNRDPATTAFVIMPFGQKLDIDGEIVDFDAVYEDIIREPLEAMGFTPLRCDEIEGAGTIHRDMFEQIATAQIAVVDLTTLNPNVFYELGVRHALRSSITILIQRRGTTIPFNIHSERIIQYPDVNGSNTETRIAIKAFIAAGVNSPQPDSPIFTTLQDVRKDWKTERISQLQSFPYRFKSAPHKQIIVVTGDIREWRGIDVWVNSENSNLQMARFFDRTLSAIIRYEGASKDENDEIVEDTIAIDLLAQLRGRQSVTPGTIYVTTAGALALTKGVKKVFHAATVYGVPGSGYQTMAEVEKCVTAALRRIDQPQFADDHLRSIIFPMMGTGSGGGKVENVGPLLIQAAINYITANPNSTVETVYFSAWNHRDLEICTTALANSHVLERAG